MPVVHGKYQFLSGRQNYYYLFFPIFLVVISLVDIVFPQLFQLISGSLTVGIIVDLLFLNIVHNAFSFILIGCLSEMKSWVEYHGNRMFWLKIGGLIIILSAGIYLFLSHVFNSTTSMLIGLLIFTFLPIHHALFQTMGLSYVYTVQDSELKRRESNLKYEKFFFIFILWGNVIGAVFAGYNFHLFQKVRSPLSFIVFISVLFIVARTAMQGLREAHDKLLFQARLFLWPLAFFSFVGILATRIVHGVEYYFVSVKMLKESKRISYVYVAALFLIIICAFACVRIYYLHSTSIAIRDDILLKTVTSISISITLVHYYLDRILFRMRKPINRQTTGTLLKQ